MCAGTVVEPPGETSAAIESVTSRSRSVAFRLSLPRSALTRTLARIGIVLRRSTTRWTCPSDLRSSARSTVTFMGDPLRRLRHHYQGVTASRRTRNAKPGSKGDERTRVSQERRFGRAAYPQGVHSANKSKRPRPDVEGGLCQLPGDEIHSCN